MKIYFVTGNINKFNEVKLMLPEFDVEQLNLDIPELQGEPEEIAIDKAKIASMLANKLLFIEDTSLCMNALNGLPGPYIKHFLEKLTEQGFYEMIQHYKDKSAFAQTIIGFCEPGKEPLIFKGVVNGTIVPANGRLGFKFDRIFQPDGTNLRYSEMPMEQKNAISHRGLAIKSFRQYLLNRH